MTNLVNLDAPCPACGRSVARWTNGGRIPPHGKRRARHKCPHGRWCGQGNPLGGIHSNGRNREVANGYGCNVCDDARELRLAVAAFWKDHSAGYMNEDFRAAWERLPGGKLEKTALCVWAIGVWLNYLIVTAHVVALRERQAARKAAHP